jgi:hypothetical protein
MTKKTYYTICITVTVIAVLLDLLTGEPFTSGPITPLYTGFLLGFVTAYWAIWATNRRSAQRTPHQKQAQ